MRLLFCDALSLRPWICCQVADRAKHPLESDARAPCQFAYQTLCSLQTQGLRLACTVSTASFLVTDFYKGEPPLAGGPHGFIKKKSFARIAATLVLESIELLAPSVAHFKMGHELWFAHCEHGKKESYAGFSDYVDAAMILAPPDGHKVPHVIVGQHAHVPYILYREKYTGQVHRSSP